ncbi:stage III sporulation protein AF [Cohnella mopanensis]|uniref:stage III sporulation protein AF n=1 Tax=Cohnella mopanensis TaxID=2911966 RepID=UPI001EF98F45|nr:stage III sporulation protein AF [Cohnella mopanensis]
MGLMDGLSHWLRQIIAVVLLAALIDLLLPNRTMQRYVRLVAGLFILMTLATPIMNWMKGDFTGKLAAGLDAVEQSPQGADSQLAMIEKAGAELRDKHQIQATKLVTSKLETSIRNEVEQTEQREVRKVDVVLGQEADGTLTVAKVVVLMEPETAAGDRKPESLSNRDVKPVEAVDIQIDDIEGWPDGEQALPSAVNQEDRAVIAEPATGSEKQGQAEEQLDRETSLRISAMIASRFGLAVNIVEVKLPAGKAASGNRS